MDVPRSQLPPLEWIRAFEAAARCGSFTAAASEIGITQSAVSQRIAQLERRLGATLFQREARAVSLTVEGEAWLPHVQSALGALRDSSEALFGADPRSLTISASQSVIELWILPRLEAFKAIAGGQLSIQTMVLGAHDAPPDDVLGIRYGTGNWPLAYKQPLYSERLAPVASPQLVKDARDWRYLPRIACSGPRPGWHDWTSQCEWPTTPVPHLRFDTFLSGLSAALAGEGVLLGSLPLCSHHFEEGRLVQLGEDILYHHETYWLIADKPALSRLQWDAIAALTE